MLSLYIHVFELMVIVLLSWFLLSKRGRQVFRRLKKSLREEVELPEKSPHRGLGQGVKPLELDLTGKGDY